MMLRYRMIKHIMPFLILLLIVIAAGCSANSTEESITPVSKNYFIFDTIVTVRVYDSRVTDAHFNEIEQLLERIDQRMNRQRAGSEIDNVNKKAGQAAVQVSEETFHVVTTALKYASDSDGRFDPSIGPLVDLWGIGSDNASIPAAGLIKQTLQLVNHNDVTVNEDTHAIMLNRAGMSLDLGAIAKGYAADIIGEYLEEQGFASAIIDLGGNILAKGTKPNGQPWSIGIQAPDKQRGTSLGMLRVTDQTVVTSGVYERYFEENGQVYHHILSPQSGYPVANDLLSVTIITDKSIDADAMSTTVFSLGLDSGMTFVEAQSNAEAIFVASDKKVYLTSGLKDRFEMTSNEYQMAK